MAQRQVERHEAATQAPVTTVVPLLGRLNRRGFRLLMVADFVVVFGIMAATVAYYILVTHGRRTYPVTEYSAAFAAFTLLFVATYYFGGLYEREPRLGYRPALPQVTSLSVFPWLMLALTELLSGRNWVPRGALPLVLASTVMGVAGSRQVSRSLRRRNSGPPRVLLVGAPDDINLAQTHLKGDPSCAIVVGHAAHSEELEQRARETRATEVLLLSSNLLDDVYPEPLDTLEGMGVGVLQRVSARDTLLGLQGVREIGGMPFVALRTHTLPVSRARFKRSIELVVLVLAVPVMVPLTALVGIYVRIVAGSPVLFWQERVGREGRPFRMVKFRTMYPNAEEGVGAVLARHGDPRVIPACQWLRATRLDELPQLWNVVRGEMSIVGPRPERPELTAQFEALIPGYARRHEIPPGITGLAQIHGRYHTDPEYKLGHDLQYLVNWSPILDLQILLRTLWVVLTRRV
jgi:exopolysaccharide biosynthesis polyprenyl glycosylphosphotransferase